MKRFLLTVMAMLLIPGCAFAYDFTEKEAVRAIIGEASNQGYEGMLAVACAVRNRGTLSGVWGTKAKHIDSQSKQIWDQARKAWRQSASVDVTHGATNWENTKEYGTPSWTLSMDKVYVYRDHDFYREKRKEKQ